MASLSVRFLGCKVSHADAQDIRERLLGDGHVERDGEADVALVNTCCVTNHVGDDLVAALRETPAVSRPLHLRLQSGDGGVLGDMARRYTAATFLRKVARLEDFNVTTDVIVGFPTETDGAFRNTLTVLRESRVTKIHVFPYSPRPGAVTAGDDAVEAPVGELVRVRGASVSEEGIRAA